jgi:2-polyprenyl-6-methoxyphenol hydroxylase-like FAD-dependent oxidoreductase
MQNQQNSLNASKVDKRVLVTGGSIAANTLAWWLVEAGFTVTVIEKATEFRKGGQSIDVRGIARTVIERMGIAEQVDRNGTGETGWTYVDENGELVAAFRLEDVGGEGPTAKFEILRGDLAHIMYEHVRDRVDYRFGDSIAAIDNGADAVHVRLESGKEEDYDLVLVAEGVGSTTRELLFEGENDPRWMDMTLGFFTIPKEESDGTEARWYNAPGGRCIFLRPDSHGTTRAVLTLQQEARKAENKSDEEAKAWLQQTFADAGWEAPRVLAGLEQADDLYFQVLRQVKMERWSDGRVALTGDAAWCATPVSGIGTTLSIVGAYVLAGELAKTDDYGQAFQNYERIMRPFVDEGQSVGKFNQLWTYPHSKFGITLQHAALNVLSKPGIRDLFLKIGMRDPEDIDLPDYEFDRRPHSLRTT